MNRHVSLCILALSAVSFCLCYSFEVLPHLKELDDKVGFRFRYRPHSELPSSLLEAPQEQVLSLVSADNEKYLCAIPEIEPSTKSRKISSYTGPSPADLISPLYNEQCSYRNDGYWSYEICPGRFLRQFHEEKTGEVTLEYYMGHYRTEEVAKEARAFDELNPPTKRIEGKDVAYYPVVYRQGSVCDLSEAPRVTTMNYVCWPNAEDYVQSIREVTSCVYEVFVYTKRICSHPAFPPPLATEHDINCYAENDDKEARPKAVLKMEEDLKRSFNSDYQVGGSSAAAVDINDDDDEDPTSFTVRVFNPEDLSEEDHDNLVKMLDTLTGMGPSTDKYVNQLKEKLATKMANQGAESSHAGTMADILLNECIIGGGAGYWKYELCYGKKVTQFHEENNGRRTEIVLGYFDEKVHKAFIEQNPGKRPVRNEEEEVIDITHIYAGGDMCGELNAHRSVEVHFRCRPLIGNRDVSVYFDEPKVCQYVLTVDSPHFCEEMQTADTYGFMSMDRAGKGGVSEDSASEDVKTPTPAKPVKSPYKKEVIGVIPGPASTEKKSEKSTTESERPPKPEL